MPRNLALARILATVGASAAVILALGAPARGQSRTHSGPSHAVGEGAPVGTAVAAVGSPYWYNFWPPIYWIGTPMGVMPYVPPLVLIGPGGVPPFLGPPPIAPGAAGWVGPAPAPMPIGPPAAPPIATAPARTPPVRPDPARSSDLVTRGDRFFRAGRLKRAEERYEQAIAAQPDAAEPRVRLAQLALLRKDYAEAAARFREAEAAQPGWLINARDIQALYGEPGDFLAVIRALETHLQAHPTDRDAWLVLGAQYYLSGRTRQAADIFLRLTDRRADPTLQAFLLACQPEDPPGRR